jgi:hypothetical protein
MGKQGRLEHWSNDRSTISIADAMQVHTHLDCDNEPESKSGINIRSTMPLGNRGQAKHDTSGQMPGAEASPDNLKKPLKHLHGLRDLCRSKHTLSSLE